MSQLVVSSRVRRGGALLAAVLVAAGCNSAADTEIAATSSVVPATSSAAPSETGQRPAEAVAPSPDAAVPTRTAAAPDVTAGTSEFSVALEQLAALPVKGRAPKTGYDRDLFGQAWSDDVGVEFGHNGCDTRNDILRRDLVDVEYRPGTRDCVVISGTLHDAYTGTMIPFVRGEKTSSAVQIDHVVALSDAWQKGAQQLDPQTRADFANDPRNLQAVDGPTNQQKGDGDAATWLPPDRSYRCTYVARQIQVKSIYGLWVTQAEHDAMARILTTCGGAAPPPATPTPATTTTVVPPPAPAVPSTPPAQPAPAPAQPAPATVPESVYYENCAAARAAGAAPLYLGEPGYRPKMDGDGDGIACE